MSKLTMVKTGLFFICLVPFFYMVTQFFADQANPLEYVTRATGDWSLRFLLITLAVTPIRILTGYGKILRVRRMLGLFAFFYVFTHLMIYAFLDLAYSNDVSLSELASYVYNDIVKRPYITVGFSAFLLLIPLAVTSTNRMMKRLGKKWRSLHKSVYLVAILGVVHYFWLVKKDLTEPVIYAGILTALFAVRLAKKVYWKKLAAITFSKRSANEV